MLKYSKPIFVQLESIAASEGLITLNANKITSLSYVRTNGKPVSTIVRTANEVFRVKEGHAEIIRLIAVAAEGAYE